MEDVVVLLSYKCMEPVCGQVPNFVGYTSLKVLKTFGRVPEHDYLT